MSDPRYLPGGITDQDLDGPTPIPESEICGCGHSYGCHDDGGACAYEYDPAAEHKCDCDGFTRLEQTYYDGEPDDDIRF